jgi:hypothetical protein
MGYIELQCPRCGAPVPESTSVIECSYCAAQLVPTRDGFRVGDAFASEDLDEPQLPRFWLGGLRHRIEGRIGRGEYSDVFLARRDARLSERVVAKVLRPPEERERLMNEWSIASKLQSSVARGSAHFTRLLPQPVACGEARLGVRGGEGEVAMALYRYESGFVHTFEDVRNAYPQGIPATAAVWLFKRILEIASFVHESGWVHGAVLPRHLLVHARDHGVRLCGWACAARHGDEINATVGDAAAFYPPSAPRAEPRLDIAMAARSLLWLLGGDPKRAPEGTPPSLGGVLESAAAESGASDAWQVLEAVDRAAAEAFGKPKFALFAMPGWDMG